MKAFELNSTAISALISCSQNLLPNLTTRQTKDVLSFDLAGINYQQLNLIGSFKSTDNSSNHFDLSFSPQIIYFDSFTSINEVFKNFDKDKENLFVLHLALEAAQNPLKILGTLKDFLARSLNSRLLYLVNETVDLSTVYRRWSKEEAKEFFKFSGLKVEEHQLGLLVSYDENYEQEVFKEFFGFDFSPAKVKTIMVTNEYAPAKQTGGIGTFVHNRYLINPEEVVIVYLDQIPNARELGIITPELFFEAKEIEKLAQADLALEIVRILSVLFVNANFVHYHDFTGIGFRIAQGARSRELPERINTICSLNGNHQYVENGNGVWSFFIDEMEVAQEKIATELADHIIAPTNFIVDLTKAGGFNLEQAEMQVLSHPVHLKPVIKKTREKIKKLVFFGKRVQMKGFPAFLNIAKKIVNSRVDIDEIIILAPPAEGFESELADLKSLVTVSEYSLPSRDAKNFLTFLAPKSLVIFPNSAENFGNVLMEAVSEEIPFVCNLAGGWPEVLPVNFHDHFGASSQNEMYEKVLKLIELEPEKLQEIVLELKKEVSSRQVDINAKWLDLSSKLKLKKFTPINLNSGDVSLMIPVYETKLKYVEELFKSLDLLTLKPSEVIVVDDFSSDEYFKSLSSLVKDQLKLPHQLIRTEKNLGVAGARNLALSVCNTKYLANIDSDDIPYPNFILSLLEAIESMPNSAAAIGYCSIINVDSEIVPEEIYGSFKSYGDGIVANLRLNKLGIAMSIVDVEKVRSLGAWSGGNKEIGDDFRLLIKMISAGYQISIAPVYNAFYRSRHNSVTHELKSYQGDLLTAVELNNLPKFERIRTQSVIQSAWNFYGEYLGAIDKIHKLYDQLDLKKQSLEKAEQRIAELELKIPRY